MKPNHSQASVNVDWFHSMGRSIALLSAQSQVPGFRTALVDLSEAYRFHSIHSLNPKGVKDREGG